MLSLRLFIPSFKYLSYFVVLAPILYRRKILKVPRNVQTGNILSSKWYYVIYLFVRGTIFIDFQYLAPMLKRKPFGRSLSFMRSVFGILSFYLLRIFISPSLIVNRQFVFIIVVPLSEVLWVSFPILLTVCRIFLMPITFVFFS